MKRILGILFLLLLFQPVLPHYKARYHVIIDTDGGIDAYIQWVKEGSSVLSESLPDATGLIMKSIEQEENAGVPAHVRKVFWYNDTESKLDFNYAVDAVSAEAILKSGLSEYFHLGIDELEILSFAGSTPPVSCLNDGLQVSTGATLGHGTITLGEGPVNPKAHFAFKDRVIEISVRPDIRQKIKKDVGYGIQTYGIESAEYWEYIRRLALKYWLELDRFEIFDIREISLSP